MLQETHSTFQPFCYLKIATFLDPRFRNTYSDMSSSVKSECQAQDQDDQVPCTNPKDAAVASKNKSRNQGSHLSWNDFFMITPTTTPAQMQKKPHKCMKLELDLYLATLPLSDKNVNPLEWWQANSPTYPLLSSLARKYLSIRATSVAS